MLFIVAILSSQASHLLIKSLLAVLVNGSVVVSQLVLPPGLERYQLLQRHSLRELSPQPEPQPVDQVALNPVEIWSCRVVKFVIEDLVINPFERVRQHLQLFSEVWDVRWVAVKYSIDERALIALSIAETACCENRNHVVNIRGFD